MTSDQDSPTADEVPCTVGPVQPGDLTPEEKRRLDLESEAEARRQAEVGRTVRGGRS
jgi:hypothetical protein